MAEIGGPNIGANNNQAGFINNQESAAEKKGADKGATAYSDSKNLNKKSKSSDGTTSEGKPSKGRKAKATANTEIPGSEGLKSDSLESKKPRVLRRIKLNGEVTQESHKDQQSIPFEGIASAAEQATESIPAVIKAAALPPETPYRPGLRKPLGFSEQAPSVLPSELVQTNASESTESGAALISDIPVGNSQLESPEIIGKDTEPVGSSITESKEILEFSPSEPETALAPTSCPNGHSLEPQETVCMACGLTERAESVQRRIRETEISIDETVLSRILFSKSRQELDAEWAEKRSSYPDSNHDLLRSLMDRKSLSDEDLIILLAASLPNFVPAEHILEQAAGHGNQIFTKRGKKSAQGKLIKFDSDAVSHYLSLSRAEIYEEIDRRIENFARCGIEALDMWADTYRLERSFPLEKCLVLLAVPKECWLQLPKQEYVAEILKFGERSIMATINQGPLVYLRLSRNTSNFDITELGGPHLFPEEILDRLLALNPSDIEVDPELLKSTPMLERRIRNLVLKSTIFKRDTAKHGLFLGFPFVVMRTRANDDTKTKLRVAPILLFPARIDAQLGSKGKITISSSDSDEVRLNPALPGILGLTPADEELWKEALEDIVSREQIRAQEIVDIFSRFCQCYDDGLVPIPGKEFVTELDQAVLSYSAALFHCDFAGKAVADDLRNIAGLPIAGTALEVALRVDDKRAESEKAEQIVPSISSGFDPEDYSVITADPSQEAAVQHSRQSRGLHIEGPPGTGKSQTIVNIIADCVARNETVLVVCQKQAALTVVERRLKAEGLGRRLFFVTDVTKDRQSVVRALREQLDERNAGLLSPVAQLRKERSNLASRIQSIESDLNKHHASVNYVDEIIGLSYRDILSELIHIEAVEPFVIKIPRLKAIFKDYDNARATALVEECASIAQLWMESKFEVSPLHDLKVFAPDHADSQMVCNEFLRFMKAEERRFQTLGEYPRSADVDDITIYVAWLRENEEYIREIPKEVRVNLSRWVGHFFPDAKSNSSTGAEAIQALVQTSDALSKLNRFDHTPHMFEALASLPANVLNTYVSIAKSATTVGGFITQINPMHAFNKFRLRNILRSMSQRTNDKTMFEFLRAASLEQELRKHRQTIDQIYNTLGLDPSLKPLDLYHLQNAISVLLSQLGPVAELSSKLRACPLPHSAKEFARRSEPGAFDEFSTVLRGVIKRHAVKTDSLNCLSKLSEWFEDEWLQAQKRVISSGKGNIEASRHMYRFLSTLIPFQEFRLRSQSLSPHAIEVFAALREHETALLGAKPKAEASYQSQFLDALSMPSANSPSEPVLEFAPKSGAELVARIQRVIRREACLTWKSMFETKAPVLTVSKEEINYKINSLAEAEETLRNLNRRILAEPNPDASVSPPKKWEDITRLSGARAKRLRELVANGEGLGLMNLRPIWLMNPETASRLLPLTPGLFDAVIFDEASQLLVEYALPSLFRAKRAIVSGDEKQMPPPNFFAARIQNEESLGLEEDEIDDLLPQAERDRIEESWNRREIKDCPDLLNLASAVLPSRSLQIHYRSEFRELIAFSNAAFYSGTLSVPRKHPARLVQRARPIEVISVNSVYEKQVNRGEAQKIAEILQSIWSAPATHRPTVGVVSFNLKQADLIEEILEGLAARNERFKEAFEEESKRTEDGEDLGFFVKNLENVQGDERDIIIFSTTFGYDSAGSFRRNFGKLGQAGGERRLNVAITRAKQKVILVTSLPTEKISDYLNRNGNPTIPRDYMQAYMDYAHKVSNGNLELADKGLSRLAASDDPRARLEVKVEDPFIMDVAAFVRSLGYEVVTRQKESNDAFDIDIAVENPRTGMFGIGIECDAPHHHLLTSAKHRELWRQSVLGKSIPRIHRLYSRDWYQRKDREKQLLQEAITQAFFQGE